MSKFKVGDVVKIIDFIGYDFNYKAIDYIGQVGVIEVIDNDEFPFSVDFNNEDLENIFFRECELAVLEKED